LISFVSKQAKNCKAILSVCTGSFILHACGLLEGKKATTHWLSLEHLRKLKGVEVVEKRIVKDGSIWTSSGVSAGSVQSFAEYYPSGKNYGTFHQDPKAPGYLRGES
jgi:transcriptional regulator GlxA family with amidase domain